jgi:hypothetical protein
MSEFEDKLNKILSSPEEMEKIMSIARSFTGSSGKPAEGGAAAPQTAQEPQGTQAAQVPLDLNTISSTLGSLDPKIFRFLTRLTTEYSTGKNDKAVLLNAIKPYLREDRHAKIDRAAEIAKLARLAKVAFSEFSGGNKSV